MNKNSLTNLPEPRNGGQAPGTPGTLHHVMRCGIKETKIFKFIIQNQRSQNHYGMKNG